MLKIDAYNHIIPCRDNAAYGYAHSNAGTCAAYGYAHSDAGTCAAYANEHSDAVEGVHDSGRCNAKLRGRPVGKDRGRRGCAGIVSETRR